MSAPTEKGCYYCGLAHAVMAEYWCSHCRQTFCDVQATRHPREGSPRPSMRHEAAPPEFFHRVRLPMEVRYCGPLRLMEI